MVPQLQRDCVLIRFTSSQPDFVAGWLPFSAADPDLLRGLLLTACRHRAMSDSGPGYAQFAAGYKARQLRVVRESIADGSVAARRRAVTRAIMLVVDEVLFFNTPFPDSRPHCTNKRECADDFWS